MSQFHGTLSIALLLFLLFFQPIQVLGERKCHCTCYDDDDNDGRDRSSNAGRNVGNGNNGSGNNASQQTSNSNNQKSDGQQMGNSNNGSNGDNQKNDDEYDDKKGGGDKNVGQQQTGNNNSMNNIRQRTSNGDDDGKSDGEETGNNGSTAGQTGSNNVGQQTSNGNDDGKSDGEETGNNGSTAGQTGSNNVGQQTSNGNHHGKSDGEETGNNGSTAGQTGSNNVGQQTSNGPDGKSDGEETDNNGSTAGQTGSNNVGQQTSNGNDDGKSDGVETGNNGSTAGQTGSNNVGQQTSNGDDDGKSDGEETGNNGSTAGQTGSNNVGQQTSNGDDDGKSDGQQTGNNNGSTSGQSGIGSAGDIHGGQQANNQDAEQMIATEFMKWIDFVAGLNHSHFPAASNEYEPSTTINVDGRASAGSGVFSSIQAAIDSIPTVNSVRVVIMVAPGVYKEKLIISQLRSYITIQGSGAGGTVVEWGGDGTEQQGAFASATVSVNAPYFVARNITIKNTNSNAEGGHGVALRVSGDAASFTGCRFMGTSNTLYDHIGRHYYKECSIEGAVDFIFGQALSMFEGCNLSALADAAGKISTHTGVSLLENSGMSFHNCRLTGAALAYLGKAWGTFSRIIIANSFLDQVQLPRGFGNTTQFHVFFGQYSCYGPGADFAIKSSWSKELSSSQVQPFISLDFIDGNEWIIQRTSDNNGSGSDQQTSNGNDVNGAGQQTSNDGDGTSNIGGSSGGQRSRNGDEQACNADNGYGGKMIAAAFMKWIDFIAGLQHSYFPAASNKFEPSRTINVSIGGASEGGFSSIQAAIDSIPMVNLDRVVIMVGPGVYKEKLIISPLRSYITIQGSGAGDTVVEWGGDGTKQQGAFASATVSVNAPYFIARNITFKNTNSDAEGGHGVALRVSGDAASFTGCRFAGTSNTLYDHIGRHYYKECSIEGAVDFIFGEAISMFQGCNLSALADSAGKFNTHTGVGLLNNAGMSFHDCRLAGAALAYLGRAWGTFSRIIIVDSFIDHVQLPMGFENMIGPKTQLNIFFGLHNCHGPGADYAIKFSWSQELSLPQVQPFVSLKFIDGNEWIKQ